MPGFAGIVGGHTGVVAGMACPHGLNAEDTHAGAGLGHHDAIVGVDTAAVLRPGHVDGQVALVDRAGGRDHVQFVDALLAKVEGHDLGQHCVGTEGREARRWRCEDNETQNQKTTNYGWRRTIGKPLTRSSAVW